MPPLSIALIRSKSKRLHRLAMAWALTAFVLMQWIATLHGIVHEGIGHAPPHVATMQGSGDSAASSVGNLLTRLVSSHEDGSSLCLGIDHLAHAAALTAVVPTLTLPPPEYREPGGAFASSEAPAERSYLARAPPAWA